MKKILFTIILLTIVININVFAKTYDLSQVSQVKLITEYDDETSVEEIDTVTFGSYPQSDASGNTKEPIEWIVLDRQGNKAFLLSKYILDVKQFDSNDNYGWEQSTLRNWLNTTFYNIAFSSSEKSFILETTNSNSFEHGFKEQFSSEYKVIKKTENFTNDNVFCLSKEEVLKYFENSDLGCYGNATLAAKGTNYAKTRSVDGQFARLRVLLATGNSGFWLRTLGYTSRANVFYCTWNPATQYLKYFRITPGRYVRDLEIGVRPAMWVSTSDLSGASSNNDSSNQVNVNNSISNNKNKNTNNSSSKRDTNDGWVEDRYYRRGQLATNEWIQYGNDLYYVGSEGRIVKNQWIGDYYVDATGKMLKNTMTPDGFYVDVNGKRINNAQGQSGQVANVNQNTNTNSNKGGGTIVGLPSRQSEFRSDNHFYLDNSMQKSTWVYYITYYYHVDGQGNIEKSKWIEQRYVGADGRMYRGRQTPDGKWLGDDGLVVNVSQDLSTSLTIEAAQPDSWYRTQSGLWYYFENDRTTTKKGWFHDTRDDQRYYLDPNTGIMTVGWTTIGGSEYYFNESHDNETNWYETGDGFYESYNKKVKAYGSMFKNELTPDGKRVDVDGKLIQNEKKQQTSMNMNRNNGISSSENNSVAKVGDKVKWERKSVFDGEILESDSGENILDSEGPLARIVGHKLGETWSVDERLGPRYGSRANEMGQQVYTILGINGVYTDAVMPDENFTGLKDGYYYLNGVKLVNKWVRIEDKGYYFDSDGKNYKFNP